MKKIISSLIIMVCLVLPVLAQQMPNRTGKYLDQYILSDAFKQCGNLYSYDTKDGLRVHGRIFTDDAQGNKKRLRDYAQLYHTDTTITIIGIAAFNYRINLDYELGAFYAIADTAFNYIKTVNLQNMESNEKDESGYVIKITYNELLFDEPIDIIGDYYVVINLPKLYPYGDNPYFGQKSFIDIGFIMGCSVEDSIMVRDFYYYKSDGGYYYSDTLTDWYPIPRPTDAWEWENRISSIRMFPIMKAADSSALSSATVENFTYIFPNPTSDNVTVQCSFRIKTIEVYNSLGQKVEEFSVDGYNKSINTEKYPKGNYILKIITESGTVDKKLVVQ